MKTWKRALALVLALVMALSLVALPSFAAGEEDSAKTQALVTALTSETCRQFIEETYSGAVVPIF